MTNDAPERIWAIPFDVKVVCDGEYHHDGDVGGIEYIRADHAQAEKEAAVAAEREACAEAVEERAALARSKPDWCITAPICEAEALRCASRIRARADTDALAARDAEVRAKALLDVEEILIDEGWLGDTRRRVRALISTDQKGDQ